MTSTPTRAEESAPLLLQGVLRFWSIHIAQVRILMHYFANTDLVLKPIVIRIVLEVVGNPRYLGNVYLHARKEEKVNDKDVCR